MSVYGKLYDIVATNLDIANQKFGYNKETFLRDVSGEPQTIDVSKYLDLSNPDFFQAVFVNAYKRLPDEREYGIWEKYFSEEEEKFRKKFLKSVSNSTVTAINHMRIINNPYFKQQRSPRYFILGLAYGLTDKSFLRELGKKMPQPIQKIIRKVFL